VPRVKQRRDQVFEIGPVQVQEAGLGRTCRGLAVALGLPGTGGVQCCRHSVA